MVNEYGAKLDRNGYAPSLFETERGTCTWCKRWGDTARHELVHGPYRKKAKALGLWFDLCPECHNRVHNSDGELDMAFKRAAQRAAMNYYKLTVEEWREKFGKNYLEGKYA